jgi:hypothetical protein
MRKSFVADILCRTCLTAGLALLMAGCATTAPPAVRAPGYSPATSPQAVASGARAMADFRHEHFTAAAQHRAANYAGAREELAGALMVLRPSVQAPGAPEYAPHAINLETALAAMDRIIAAERRSNREDAAIGWEMLDQSAKALMTALAR